MIVLLWMFFLTYQAIDVCISTLHIMNLLNDVTPIYMLIRFYLHD